MKDGVVYTPENIVNLMIENIGDIKNKKILEPSCGDGSFVIPLIKRILKLSDNINNDFDNLYACDIDGKALLNLKKEAFKLTGRKEWNFYKEDFLFKNEYSNFDIIIGNPPYIKAHHISQDYLTKIKTKYETCKQGTVDIYYSFIEESLKKIKDDGIVSFILPSNWMLNKSAKKLREIISGFNIKIIDFGSEKIFQGYGVYTCILTIQKKEDKSNIVVLKNKKEILINKENIKEGLPWLIGIGSNSLKAPKIKNGLATLCDKAFIFEGTANNSLFSFVSKINGRKYEVENSICKEIYKASKQSKAIAIFPYKDNGVGFTEDELANDFPLTYNYLCDIKENLLNRDFDSEWFLYGRSQGVKDFFGSKIIISPIIGEKINFIFEVNPDILVYSGLYIKTETPEEIIDILKSKELFSFLKENGKKMSGGWVSISKKIFESFFI
jgi:methylase of polypeptide subunit release factors